MINIILKMNSKTSNVFLVIFFIIEIIYIFLYAFKYEYSISGSNVYSLNLSLGASQTLGLCILLLIGFGLTTTYIAKSAYSTLIYTLLIWALGIQSYFIFKSFWIYTGLGNQNSVGGFYKDTFKAINLQTSDSRVLSSDINSTSLADAIASSIALFVIYSPSLGKIGQFELLMFSIFNTIFYTFLEVLFWRISVADSGYTMRIFIFGTISGLLPNFTLSSA